jgi:predicted oxidoreductase (fatty acid repression mutant protein)
MASTFLSVLEKRRSYYGLGKDIDMPPGQLQSIVERAVLATPSAFNSQSARAVLLLNRHHDRLWGIVKETLRGIVRTESFAKTAAKIDGFAAAAGTILYFDDMDVVTGLQQQYPSYSDNFPTWAQQANGMLQGNIWCALEEAGLGASLQHYNPLIDDAVKAEWGLPPSWRLVAQMPFGDITAPAGAKDVIPASERVLAFD